MGQTRLVLPIRRAAQRPVYPENHDLLGCRLSKQYPVDQFTSRPVAALYAPAEIPTALSSAPRQTLHVASCPRRAYQRERRRHKILIAPDAQLPATSCLGAFWTPASGARGSFVIAGIQKPAQGQKFVLYAMRVSKKKSASGLTIEFIATCSEFTCSPCCLTYSYAACSRCKSG